MPEWKMEVWIITMRKKRGLPNAKRFKRIMRDVFGISALRSRSAGTRETRANDALRAEQLLPLENIARLLQRTFSAGALRALR